MRIKVHPAFLMYLALIGLIDGIAASIGLLFTLLLHEAGHLVAGYFCGEAYAQIELTPLGGVITYRPGSASCKGVKGVLIAVAGPLCNGVAVYVLCYTPMLHLLPRTQIEKLLMMNLSMLLINMLPALPLDGGRAIFSVGYYLFPIEALIRLLAAFGCACGGLCFLAAVYGLMQWRKLNITLLACALYMIISAQRQRESIYASTLHTVIQERLSGYGKAAKASVICVNGQMKLSSVIPILCRDRRCVLMLEREGRMQVIPERSFLAQLLTNPTMTFDDAFTRKQKELS